MSVRLSTRNNSPTTYLLTYLLTCLITPRSTVLLNKLTDLQLVKKFSAFYGTRRFITAFTSAQPVSILSQLNPVHSLTSHFLDIHLNIILPSIPGSSQWPLSVRFSHQNPVQASPFPHPGYMLLPTRSSRVYHLHITYLLLHVFSYNLIFGYYSKICREKSSFMKI
jgi:hypothetical protein